MKRIWSSSYFGYLLLLLVLGFFGYASFAAPELSLRLAAAGMAAHCLVCFLDAQGPASPAAGKLRKILSVAGSGLMCAAMILVAYQYIGA